jgi:hypothetical protein
MTLHVTIALHDQRTKGGRFTLSVVSANRPMVACARVASSASVPCRAPWMLRDTAPACSPTGDITRHSPEIWSLVRYAGQKKSLHLRADSFGTFGRSTRRSCPKHSSRTEPQAPRSIRDSTGRCTSSWCYLQLSVFFAVVRTVTFHVVSDRFSRLRDMASCGPSCPQRGRNF